MVHGEADAEHVDEDPQHVQHIVPEWSLQNDKMGFMENLAKILTSPIMDVYKKCFDFITIRNIKVEYSWRIGHKLDTVVGTWMSGQDGLFR